MKRYLFTVLILLAAISLTAEPVRWALRNLPDANYSDFHDGMSVFQDKQTKLYGAIGTDGKIVIPATFKKMNDFAGGACLVETEEGKGFINKKGMFLFGPDTVLQIEKTTSYDQYGEYYRIPGLYTITDKKTKASGYWYNNKMIIPIATAKSYQLFFPFIAWKDEISSNSHIFNLETGELLIGSILKKGALYEVSVPSEKGTIVRLFDSFGTEQKNISTSSYGVRLEPGDLRSCDMISNQGDTLISAKDGWCNDRPIWLGDKTIMYKRNPDDATMTTYRLYDGKGKILFEKKDVTAQAGTKAELGNSCVCIHYFGKELEDYKSELYNAKGKCVLAPNTFIHHIYGDWYKVYKEDYTEITLYNMSSGKKYTCRDIKDISEGVVFFQDKKEQYYMMNVDKDYVIALSKETNYVSAFHEGVALIHFKYGYYWHACFVDKNYNLSFIDDEDISYSAISSEGVVRTSKNGFIYNPFIKDTPIYGKEEHKKWLYDEGVRLFEKKQYAKAKEKFYDIMLNDPENVNSIVYYACCLGNMGYYDSAIDALQTALSIDPDNEFAKDNLKIAESNKLAAEQKQEYQYDQTMNWFDGLTQFLNILGDAVSQYAGYSTTVNSSSSSGYSSGYNTTSSSSSNYHSGNENISRNRDARTYSDLESQLIKMNTYYNTYNDNQRRSIQSQMRSIRTKWESRGFRMYHSSWEDWNGSKR